ncbi:ankyrin repeat domain-containing protein 6 isoform X2 [Hippocampus zosterae]|uniref:ankyrin repeat domain-containing protein 6 isoform X2 n=1 Tax=Hippocampus zosterae TaxID=109293 RepID=UPI00223D6DE3|nr:ankyrin repeat domain-containing protein 6 isoform X2 [Hippocampus zosterae]
MELPSHQTALHRAAILGNSDAISALIQGGCALDLQNRDGNTALHEVSWHGFLQCVKLLVKAGANVHIKNKAGNTALHLASQNDHAQTARLLLVGGATPDTKNKKGETALHVAAALSHKRTVKLLLDSGADGKIRNNAGLLASDIARKNNHRHVVLLLAKDPQRESPSLVAEMHMSDPIGSKENKMDQEGPLQNHFTPTVLSKPMRPHRWKRGKGQEFHIKRDPIARDNSPISYGNCFHLYTLYRDTDGNVRQAPANGCHCRPKIKKLEEKLKGTQEELRLHILNMHEQVDSRLRKMDRKSKHQMKVLDMLNQERAASERNNIMHRIEQVVAQGKEEALIAQKAMNCDLKKWCMAQIPISVESQHYKLLPSSPVEQSDTGLESTPLLSVVSAESGTSLATYVNICPMKSTQSLGGDKQELMGSRKYFGRNTNWSPDDYEQKALCSKQNRHAFGFLVDANDLCRQTTGVQESGRSFSSSSRQSSLSIQSPLSNHHQRTDRRSGKLTSDYKCTQMQADCTRTLEFFVDPPSEPTLIQERNHWHAMEVTQHFFETVSIQLERWYERKVLEVEEQTKVKMEQERQELLQHINVLEEELQKLKTGVNAET